TSVSTDSSGEPPRSPSTASSQQPSARADQVSFNAGPLDALFREFLEYQKQEAQRAGDNPSENEALFAEFQTLVKQQLDRQRKGVRTVSGSINRETDAAQSNVERLRLQPAVLRSAEPKLRERI